MHTYYKPLITSVGALCWLGFLLWALAYETPTPAAFAQSDRVAGTPDDELVYLDPAGFIHVLEPDLTVARSILWVSPDGGWRDIALGDFNGDGDAEIAAIGGEGAGAKLAIYDPVVADLTGIDPNKVINEIPWNLLYFTTTISSTLAAGKPMRVAAGEFNPDLAGTELIFSLALTDPDQAALDTLNFKGSRLHIWQRQTTSRTNQLWQPRIRPLDSDKMWSAIVLGEIDNRDNRKIPEIVLLDDNDGVMRVYQLQGNQLAQLYNYESNDRPWLSAAIGQIYNSHTDLGGFGELVAVRRSPQGLPSMIVFRYLGTPQDDQLFKDQLTDYFNPPADQVFLANVNGLVQAEDGGIKKNVDDEEIFMLRNNVPVPRVTTTPSPPRLFMRNPGEDKKGVAGFETALDADNNYQAGVKVNTEVDGKDEIAVMRNNRIRIYLNPDGGPSNIRDYTFTSDGKPISTDSKTLRAANLDNLGYPRLPRIVINPNQLAQTMPAGNKSETVITVTNEGNGESVPFSVFIGGAPSWLSISPADGKTPGQVTIRYDALGLPPVSSFNAFLTIAPNDPRVPAKSVNVGVKLSTTPGLWPTPDRVVGLVNCDNRTPVVAKVRVAGLQGVFYNANLNDLITVQSAAVEPLGPATSEPYTIPLVSNVTWATLTGLGTILPTTLTVTFNPGPELVQGAMLEAVLGVYSTNNQGQELNIALPVTMACHNETYYLPWVDR